jgi:hypothetical protein
LRLCVLLPPYPAVERYANPPLSDLERENAPEKKRRVTDFYFQRMRLDAIAPTSQQDPAPSHAVWSKPLAPGVPPIRLTSLERPKNDLRTKNDLRLPEAAALGATEDATGKEKHGIPGTPITPAGSKSAPTTPAQQARRFHLARHISSVLSPNAAGGIRKSKNAIRPPLATFVEKHGSALDHAQNPLYRGKPVDKILEVPDDGLPGGVESLRDKEPILDTLDASKRHLTSTFVQARPQKIRNGTSIRDDPSTWDLESDQLADELAALAMEFDPDLQQKVDAERPKTPPPAPPDVVMTTPDREEDYIYETYVRLPYDAHTLPTTDTQSNYGILVIGEDDEDLWHKYVESEDDTDWDEEDSNGENQRLVTTAHADH